MEARRSDQSAGDEREVGLTPLRKKTGYRQSASIAWVQDKGGKSRVRWRRARKPDANSSEIFKPDANSREIFKPDAN